MDKFWWGNFTFFSSDVPVIQIATLRAAYSIQTKLMNLNALLLLILLMGSENRLSPLVILINFYLKPYGILTGQSKSSKAQP